MFDVLHVGRLYWASFLFKPLSNIVILHKVYLNKVIVNF